MDRPPGQKPNRPPTETRRCDACGKQTTCVLFPTARGPNTGALCLTCLGGALSGMRDDPNW